MQHPLISRLGLTAPIIQAPMAGVSTPALAAAVSNAGGLGSIALGALTVEMAQAEIGATRLLTSSPLCLNVFTHPAPRRDRAREAAWCDMLMPLFRQYDATPPSALREIYTSFNDNAAMQALVLATQPAVLSCHFGLPDAQIARQLQAAGTRIAVTVTTVEEARAAHVAGVDMVIAQGGEAGGHYGRFLPTEEPAHSTIPLVKAIIAHCPGFPVIAAGGLMNGADCGRAMAAGAVACQLGTAFLDTAELNISAHYREALRDGRTTVVTDRVSGRLARGLDSALTRSLNGLRGSPPDYPVAYDAVKALAATAAATDPDMAVMWAGTGSASVRRIGAEELVRTLVDELQQANA